MLTNLCNIYILLSINPNKDVVSKRTILNNYILHLATNVYKNLVMKPIHIPSSNFFFFKTLYSPAVTGELPDMML